MKLTFNRYAVIPTKCNSCHRYVWLEKYRRDDVFHFLVGRFWKENICTDCIKKYDVGKEGRKHGD